MNVTQAKVLL